MTAACTRPVDAPVDPNRDAPGAGGGTGVTVTRTVTADATPVDDGAISGLFPAIAPVGGGDTIEIELAVTPDGGEPLEALIGDQLVTGLARDSERVLHGAVPPGTGARDFTLRSANWTAKVTGAIEYRHWTGARAGILESEVQSVAAHPSAPSRVYASTRAGKVFRSEDGGTTWREMGHGVAKNWMNPIVIAPGKPDALFSICEDRSICRSTNGAMTWHRLVQGELEDASALIADFESRRLYAAGTGWFASSTDDGQTWRVAAGPHEFFHIAVDPTRPGVVYAARGTLYRSANYGVTWREVPLDGWSPAYLYGIGVSARGTLIVAHNEGVLRSTDGGASFTRDTTWPNGYSVVRLPGDPQGRVFIGVGAGLLSSADDGQTWTLTPADRPSNFSFVSGTDTGQLFVSPFAKGLYRLEGELLTPVNDGLAAPGGWRVEAAQSGGVVALSYGYRIYRWKDGSKRWTPLPPGGLENAYGPLAALSSAGGDRIYSGPYLWTEGSAEWGSDLCAGSEIRGVAADPVVAGAGLAMTASGYCRTVDGGASWAPIAGGPVSPWGYPFFGTRVTEAGTEYYVHVNGFPVYRLSPSGAWEELGLPENTMSVTAVVASRSGAVLVLDGVAGMAHRRDPPTGVWSVVPGFRTPISGAPAGMAAAVIGRDLVLIGMDEAALYSTDGGATWRTVALPEGSVGSGFAFDKDDDKRVWGGLGFMGFLRTKNGGGFDG